MTHRATLGTFGHCSTSPHTSPTHCPPGRKSLSHSLQNGRPARCLHIYPPQALTRIPPPHRAGATLYPKDTGFPLSNPAPAAYRRSHLPIPPPHSTPDHSVTGSSG